MYRTPYTMLQLGACKVLWINESALGPDGVTNKLLRKLADNDIESLATHIKEV